MPTQADYEKGVECVENSLREKEAARGFFEAKKEEAVGVPTDGKNCPIFNFLKAACPEITIRAFGGSAEVAPLLGTLWEFSEWDSEAGDYAPVVRPVTEEDLDGWDERTVEGGDWCSDFVTRVDGPWANYFDTHRPVTGEVALGILERSGTYESEYEAFQAWLKANDRDAYDRRYGLGAQ